MKPHTADKEFALAGALNVMQITGIVTAIGAGGVAMICALYVAGTIVKEGAIAAAIFSPVLVGGAAVSLLALGRGTVTVTADRMEVRTKLGRALLGRERYKWSHINTIEFVHRRVPGVRLNALFNAASDRPLVRIRLARSLRVGLVSSGTDVFGVPSLIAKTVLLHLEDPEAFVREAQSYLQAPQR